jgi:hypothetical protein
MLVFAMQFSRGRGRQRRGRRDWGNDRSTDPVGQRDAATGRCWRVVIEGVLERTLKTEQRTERHAAVSTGRRTSAPPLKGASSQLLEGAGRAVE